MMKIAVLTTLVACALNYGPQATFGLDTKAEPNAFNCNPINSPSTVCFNPLCTDVIAAQINRELNASFTYLYMATLFDDNRIARPGMAHFLYESASEERHHAIMMIDYLNGRGVFYDKTFKFTIPKDTDSFIDPSFIKALTMALNMEIVVTNHIYDVVKACGTDYHGADFFTEPILAEQHEGVRKLQGAIRAFRDLRGGEDASPQTNALAEFIFDKKMLAEGL